MPKPLPKSSGDSPAVDACVKAFSSRLHMPDCSQVFAAIGAVAANYFLGDPVWLMLVGSPSTGKTVIVKACSNLPDCREASDSHNASAFLTHDIKRGMGGLLSPSRVEQGQQTGGIGDFGILTYPEFSMVLALPPDARAYVSGVHRKIYDGEWSREHGANGGHTLKWKGKAGALGAVTAAIDRHSMSSELGERWLYFRLPAPDHLAQANAAGLNHHEDRTAREAAFADAVMQVFKDSGIVRGTLPRELTQLERTRMSRTVKAACLLRGTISRDFHHRDIIDLPQTEGSGRMFSALTSIYLALEKLGLRNKWCWKLVRKISFDSAPALRTYVAKCALILQQAGKPITPANLHPMIPLSDGVLRRALEDIRLLGVMKNDGDGDRDRDRDGSRNEEWYVDRGIEKVFQEMEDDL